MNSWIVALSVIGGVEFERNRIGIGIDVFDRHPAKRADGESRFDRDIGSDLRFDQGDLRNIAAIGDVLQDDGIDRGFGRIFGALSEVFERCRAIGFVRCCATVIEPRRRLREKPVKRFGIEARRAMCKPVFELIMAHEIGISPQWARRLCIFLDA